MGQRLGQSSLFVFFINITIKDELFCGRKGIFHVLFWDRTIYQWRRRKNSLPAIFDSCITTEMIKDMTFDEHILQRINLRFFFLTAYEKRPLFGCFSSSQDRS
jgi:hypothetical protein